MKNTKLKNTGFPKNFKLTVLNLLHSREIFFQNRMTSFLLRESIFQHSKYRFRVKIRSPSM